MSFKVEIHGIKNASESERFKFRAACELMAFELNNDEFWKQVSANWETMTWRNYELSNKEYKFASATNFKQVVLSGRDKFNDIADEDIDVQITLYYSWKRTIGYTYPSTWLTWINRKFFSRFSKADIAGNVFHEYLHNMGMSHPGTDRRSVVYQCGYLMRDSIKKRLGEYKKISPIKYKRRLPWYKRLWKRIF